MFMDYIYIYIYIYLKTFVSTYLLHIYELGILHYKIIEEFTFRGTCDLIILTHIRVLFQHFNNFSTSFDAFIHYLDTITGQDITNTMIFI